MKFEETLDFFEIIFSEFVNHSFEGEPFGLLDHEFDALKDVFVNFLLFLSYFWFYAFLQII